MADKSGLDRTAHNHLRIQPDRPLPDEKLLSSAPAPLR